MHPTIHQLVLAANPRPHRHHHPARPVGRVRRARRLVELGSGLVRLGLRLRAAGAEQAMGARHASGAPPGARAV